MGLASSCEGGHDCCVKGELEPVPPGETIGDDLDAPFIRDRQLYACLGVLAVAQHKQPKTGAGKARLTDAVLLKLYCNITVARAAVTP